MKIHTTADNLADLFVGIMLPVQDPFGDPYRIPGWECKTCGWKVGSMLLPPPHECPGDGERQTVRSLAARVERLEQRVDGLTGGGWVKP